MNALSHLRSRPRVMLIAGIALIGAHAIFLYVQRQASVSHVAVSRGLVLAVAVLIVAKHLGVFTALLRSLHYLFRKRFRSGKSEDQTIISQSSELSCLLAPGAHAEEQVHMTIPAGFLEALPASQKAPEFAEVDDIFDWLVGSWEMEAVLHDPDGQVHRTRGELHASWVLEGRAIQDLFIFPRRADRSSGIPARGDRYATTIRTYDRKLNAWRVHFINPADDETSAQLIARREGRGIVMEGELSGGTPIRWRYHTFTPTSFHYTGEKLRSDSTWELYLELFGSR